MANSSVPETTDLLEHLDQILNSDDGVLRHPALDFLLFSFRFVINPVLAACAFVTCVLSILTFSRMKAKDGITQTFLVLSLSDGVCAALMVVFRISLMVKLSNLRTMINLPVFNIVTLFNNILLIFPVYFSMVTTTVIAIVRCIGVVMPLKSRSLMTSRVQLALIFSMNSPIFAFFCYFSSLHTVYWHIDTKTNTSVLSVLTPTRYSDTSISLIYSLVVNTIFFASFTIAVLSMAFLLAALKRSTKFRNQAASRTSAIETSGRLPSKEAQRDATIIKSVILILAVFAVGNLPEVIFSITRRLNPEFNPSGKLSAVTRVVSNIVGAGLQFNITANIFIYYTFNTRFRNTFKSMFLKRTIVYT